MKLRTAYFCKKCDEEVNIERDRHNVFECPICGYYNPWGLAIVYEWKVPDINFKKICFEERFGV